MGATLIWGQKNEPRPYQLILGYGGFEQGRCSFGLLTHHQTLVRPAGSLEVPPSGDNAIASCVPPFSIFFHSKIIAANSLKSYNLRDIDSELDFRLSLAYER
jgi:hypothetical protein